MTIDQRPWNITVIDWVENEDAKHKEMDEAEKKYVEMKLMREKAEEEERIALEALKKKKY